MRFLGAECDGGDGARCDAVRWRTGGDGVRCDGAREGKGVRCDGVRCDAVRSRRGSGDWVRDGVRSREGVRREGEGARCDAVRARTGGDGVRCEGEGGRCGDALRLNLGWLCICSLCSYLFFAFWLLFLLTKTPLLFLMRSPAVKPPAVFFSFPSCTAL
jgi:hypothetical protein